MGLQGEGHVSREVGLIRWDCKEKAISIVSRQVGLIHWACKEKAISIVSRQVGAD
jgi:hypothetical protein